jgi:hypothetical protein
MNIDKIEVAPFEYWLHNVTEHDGMLYCFSLNINGKTGWKIPTHNEYNFKTGLNTIIPIRDRDNASTTPS